MQSHKSFAKLVKKRLAAGKNTPVLAALTNGLLLRFFAIDTDDMVYASKTCALGSAGGVANSFGHEQNPQSFTFNSQSTNHHNHLALNSANISSSSSSSMQNPFFVQQQRQISGGVDHLQQQRPNAIPIVSPTVSSGPSQFYPA